MAKAALETSEVHKLADIETTLSVLQSENARLKEYARKNEETAKQNAETHRSEMHAGAFEVLPEWKTPMMRQKG